MNYDEIKDLRLKYCISQIKLADKSGFTPAMISSWELKKTIPSNADLEKLKSALTELIRMIDTEGFNIKKRTIVKDGAKTSKKKIAPIKSAEEYRSMIAKLNIETTDYKKCLNDLYANFVKHKDRTALKAISLFSGCGGMDLGFEAAGFNIIGHVEIDDVARKIYQANFPNSESLGTDICKISPKEIAKWQNKYGQVDIIVGGPPCQGFSLAGKRDPNDIRNQLYKYYVTLVSIIQPKIFVMENVSKLTTMKDVNGVLFINHIIKEFSEVGYDLSVNHVDAQNYGVPQSRERVFLIGISKKLKGHNFMFPSGNYNVDGGDLFISKQSRTFRDATKDLPELEHAESSADPLHWTIAHPQHVLRWLKDVPEGCSAHENKNPDLRPPSGFNTTYKRIMWDEPCSTISTNFNMISGCRNVHPTSTRSLTIREATRAQSFPDEFAFFGKWSDVRRVIGNAVPPLLAYEIAKAIKHYLQNNIDK